MAKSRNVLPQSSIIDFDTNTYRFYRECGDFAEGDDIVLANIKAGRGLPIDFEKGCNINYSDPEYDPLPIDPVTALLIGVPPIYADELAGDKKIALRRANGYRWHVYQDKLHELMGIRNIAELRQMYDAYSGVALHKAITEQMCKWNSTNNRNAHIVGCFLLGLSDADAAGSNPMDYVPWFPWKRMDALSFTETRYERMDDFDRRVEDIRSKMYADCKEREKEIASRENELDLKMERLEQLHKEYSYAIAEKERLAKENEKLRRQLKTLQSSHYNF